MSLEEAEANSPLSVRNVQIYVENLIEKNAEFETIILVGEHESPAFKLQGEKLSKVTSFLQGTKLMRIELSNREWPF